MISALIVAKNESLFIQGCIERVLPYVEEVIFVDNESTDDTKKIVEAIESDKIRIFTKERTNNMGELRQFSLDQATQDWIWQVDADEWYSDEACRVIVEAVKSAKEELSFRVKYHQLAWRSGHKQANFFHYPDRLYRRIAIDKYDGMLPNDMTKVKKEFYKHRPFLEYDNAEDKSFENPAQPVLDAYYYHLARTRGFNYEYNKWYRYNEITHNHSHQKLDETTRINQWVSGLYDLEPIDAPFDIPKSDTKVSIIIPNFQYAQYVGDAIDSALTQTHPIHEVIVVDDGSHDNSREVISKYPVIKKFQINGGVAHARNSGASVATGDYLLFLDADDKIEKTFIEECLQEMKGDVQVVYTDYKYFGESDCIVSQPDFSIETMKGMQVVPSTCGLMDRRVFEAVGGFDNGEIYEDWGVWLRASKFNFRHIRKPLFSYRKHGASRIDLLDSRMTEGYIQLKDRYGITREVNFNRELEAKQKLQ